VRDGSLTGFADGMERMAFLDALDNPGRCAQPYLFRSPFEGSVSRHWPTMEFRVRRAVLSDDRTLHSGAEDVDLDMLQELSLLTIKPFLYMFNADESVLTDAARMAALAAEVAPADSVFLDAKMEQELLELDEESSMELLESIGRTEPGLQALARKGFIPSVGRPI